MSKVPDEFGQVHAPYSHPVSHDLHYFKSTDNHAIYNASLRLDALEKELVEITNKHKFCIQRLRFNQLRCTGADVQIVTNVLPPRAPQDLTEYITNDVSDCDYSLEEPNFSGRRPKSDFQRSYHGSERSRTEGCPVGVEQDNYRPPRPVVNSNVSCTRSPPSLSEARHQV